jgi:hypothetical protein
MIWIHDTSIDSIQNLKRWVVIKIEDSYFLKDENDINIEDVVDFDTFHYNEWVEQGNIAELWLPEEV